MLNFNLQNGKVVLDAYTMMIAEIRQIVEDFKDNPDEGIRVLTYIHIASRLDPKAPFFGAKEEEVKELASRNTWRENIPENLSDYDDVITAYKKAYEGAESRVSIIFTDKIDQISKMIKDTIPEIVAYTTSSGSKGFATNTAIITKAMSDLDNLLDAKEKLQARMQKQVLKEGKIMGKKTPSRLEKRMMKEGA